MAVPLVRERRKNKRGFHPSHPLSVTPNLSSVNCAPAYPPPPPGGNKDPAAGCVVFRVGLFLRMASGSITWGSLREAEDRRNRLVARRRDPVRVAPALA
jgi:hypothetical protein